MKLQTKLILTIGAAALAAYSLGALILYYGAGTIMKSVQVDARESAVHAAMSSARTAAETETMLLENKFTMAELELTDSLLHRGPPHFPAGLGRGAVECFCRISSSGDSFRTYGARNQLPGSAGNSMPEKYRRFLTGLNLSSPAAFVPDPDEEGFFWLIRSLRSGELAAFRINAAKLLAGVTPVSGTSGSLLLMRDNTPIASCKHNTREGTVPDSVISEMTKRVRDVPMVFVDGVYDMGTVFGADDSVWIYAASNVGLSPKEPFALKLVKTVPYTWQTGADISNSISVIGGMIVLVTLLTILIFTPVLLSTARALADRLDRANRYAGSIMKPNSDAEPLKLTYSAEFSELAASLNYLRDKLDGVQARLAKSRSRETVARLDAANGNLLPPVLAGKILEEVSGPLCEITGYSGVLIDHADAGSELRRLLELIQNRAGKIAKALRAPGDFAGIDLLAAEMTPQAFSPADMLRDAAGAAAADAIGRSVAIETKCHVPLRESFAAPKKVLSRILASSAEIVAAFAPENSTVVFECAEEKSSFVFRFSDRTDKSVLSIAEAFLAFAASGKTPIPAGAAAAFLRIKLIEFETALTGGVFAIRRSPESNTVIEIAFPMREIASAASRQTQGVPVFNFGEPESGAVPEQNPAAVKKEILLACFRPDDAVLLKRMLQSLGLTAVISDSFPPEKCFCPVVLNCESPQKSAEAVRGFRIKFGPGVVLAAVTGSAFPDDSRLLADSGASAVLVRPFTLADLRAALRIRPA